MAWLARLDARSRRWPAGARWAYLFARWFLIIGGVYSVIGLAYIEIVREHRVGLGSGIAAAGALALIKGVVTALHQSDQPPDSPRQH